MCVSRIEPKTNTIHVVADCAPDTDGDRVEQFLSMCPVWHKTGKHRCGLIHFLFRLNLFLLETMTNIENLTDSKGFASRFSTRFLYAAKFALSVRTHDAYASPIADVSRVTLVAPSVLTRSSTPAHWDTGDAVVLVVVVDDVVDVELVANQRQAG